MKTTHSADLHIGTDERDVTWHFALKPALRIRTDRLYGHVYTAMLTDLTHKLYVLAFYTCVDLAITSLHYLGHVKILTMTMMMMMINRPTSEKRYSLCRP